MNRKQKKRLVGILCILALVGIAAGLILFALKQNINLFYTPTQLKQTEVHPKHTIRVGGYVKDHSVRYDPSGESVHFIITDRTEEINVTYHGVLPNLFREGQAVVVAGNLDQNYIKASQVLAKHDEKYVPKSLADELKKGKNYAS